MTTLLESPSAHPSASERRATGDWNCAIVAPWSSDDDFGARVVRPDGEVRHAFFDGATTATCAEELGRVRNAFGSERHDVDRLDLWTAAVVRVLRFVENTIARPLRDAIGTAARIAWVTGVEELDDLPIGFALADTAAVFRVPDLAWLCRERERSNCGVRFAGAHVDQSVPFSALEADVVTLVAGGRLSGVPAHHVIAHGVEAQSRYEELADMPAHVVLSGCSTARGLEPIRVGSSRLVSLWPIDTTLAPSFMAAYYARLARGESRVEALRGAQLAHAGSSPVVAAAFVHDGEPQ